jgi:hypothetical protein
MFAEAVTVAVERCADDTKGETCYICTQALHWKTKEGLVRGCACRGTSGFAHVSCLAEQAKILMDEAEENNLDLKVQNERWNRWSACSLCEQAYHGVVKCALGWGCWKTYLGRPETEQLRCLAMGLLGNGLSYAGCHEDALSVYEARLSLMLRVGASVKNLLVLRSNLAISYCRLGCLEQALSTRRDVYSGNLRLHGEEHEETLAAANNYASSLNGLKRFEEAKALLRKTIPVARRVLGESSELTLRMRWVYALTLYDDPGASLDDLREAVTILEETERTARRVLGGSYPLTTGIDRSLREARAALAARDGEVSSVCEAVEAMTSA